MAAQRPNLEYYRTKVFHAPVTAKTFFDTEFGMHASVGQCEIDGHWWCRFHDSDSGRLVERRDWPAARFGTGEVAEQLATKHARTLTRTV